MSSPRAETRHHRRRRRPLVAFYGPIGGGGGGYYTLGNQTTKSSTFAPFDRRYTDDETDEGDDDPGEDRSPPESPGLETIFRNIVKCIHHELNSSSNENGRSCRCSRKDDPRARPPPPYRSQDGARCDRVERKIDALADTMRKRFDEMDLMTDVISSQGAGLDGREGSRSRGRQRRRGIFGG